MYCKRLMMIIAHVVVLLVLSIALVSCTNAGTNSNIQRFTLNLAYGTASPDGFEQRMMLANGQIDYPIVVNAGDSLEITVINNMDVPTSLHWHGMFQRGSPWYDGAVGITQCPIQPGATFVYKFSVGAQVGTYWWHAHYKSQYINGLRGPFIIKDPKSPYRTLYDSEQVITLTDFYHNTSDYLLDYYFSPNEGALDPVPESGLINGVGTYDCSFAPKGSKCVANSPKVFSVVPGKRYLLRLINTAAEASFNFTIDGHTMTVIEADGVYTAATVVNKLLIASSQRYSVIVTAKPTAGNYWIRAEIDQNLWNPAPTHLNGLNPDVRAIWRVGNAPATDPTTSQTDDVLLNPYALGERNGMQKTDFPEEFDQTLYMRYILDSKAPGNVTRSVVIVGDINEVQYSMPKYPVLLSAIRNTSIPVSANVIEVNNGSYVFLQIINDDPMEHVFHLHGHTFWVWQAGNLLHTPVIRKGVGLPRRDAITVPPCIGGTGNGGESGCLKGFVALIIKFDNPGAWMFHCHIEWHMQAGLAITFVNREGLADMAQKSLPQSVVDNCGVASES